MNNVLHLDSTTSTNQVAFELAQQGSPHGYAVIARTQTGGRGRLGKIWESVPGKGLYCSIILRPNLDVSEYPKITMAAGLGVAVALERITGLQVVLKWPNDIYCNGKKCCGILSESSPLSMEESDRFAIVGIGVNVNTDISEFPEDLCSTATSLFLETDISYKLEKIFEEVRLEVLDHVVELEKDGFTNLLNRWRQRDMLYGKWLEWVTNSGDIVYGKSEGPDDSGQLLVRDEGGRLHEVISGDIRLAGQRE